MSVIVSAPRSRGRLVVPLLIVGVAFAVGTAVAGSKQAVHATAAIAGLVAVGAGCSQLVGEIWPNGQRWLLYGQVIGLAGAFGVFARMAVDVISKAF